MQDIELLKQTHEIDGLHHLLDAQQVIICDLREDRSGKSESFDETELHHRLNRTFYKMAAIHDELMEMVDRQERDSKQRVLDSDLQLEAEILELEERVAEPSE